MVFWKKVKMEISLVCEFESGVSTTLRSYSFSVHEKQVLSFINVSNFADYSLS